MQTKKNKNILCYSENFRTTNIEQKTNNIRVLCFILKILVPKFQPETN